MLTQNKSALAMFGYEKQTFLLLVQYASDALTIWHKKADIWKMQSLQSAKLILYKVINDQ